MGGKPWCLFSLHSLEQTFAEKINFLFLPLFNRIYLEVEFLGLEIFRRVTRVDVWHLHFQLVGGVLGGLEGLDDQTEDTLLEIGHRQGLHVHRVCVLFQEVRLRLAIYQDENSCKQQ